MVSDGVLYLKSSTIYIGYNVFQVICNTISFYLNLKSFFFCQQVVWLEV